MSPRRPSDTARPRPSENRIRSSALPVLSTLAALLAFGALDPLGAQGSDRGFRIGIGFGGISTVSAAVELFDGNNAVELALGTWSFRDLSLATSIKRYFGGAAVRPFVGGGLWAVAGGGGERTGFALVLRAPVGVDWNAVGDQSIGAALNFNRGLAVRRPDPQDDLPMNKRLVPLPELYYRLTR